MLTLKKSISKAKALYTCSKCSNDTEELRVRVNKGQAIFCKACTAGFYPTSSRKKYPSEYTTYHHMVSRCTNPDDKDYVKYGARGITVCKEWLASFDSFILYMGPKSGEDTTIERKDVNGNYEPGNCIWASRTIQNRNKRDTHILEFRGKTQTLAEHLREHNIPSDAVYKRIERGDSPLEAISKPVVTRGKK
jgi:DNA-directed RNA polymerase subunit RPC12/RpoP